MSDLPAPELPVRVRQRDGSEAPFDAGQISQALFLATEALGQPDAFLARELTDSVLHFLAEEDADVLDTQQITEIVARSVRELGHPLLARAFEARAEQPGARGQESAGGAPPSSPPLPQVVVPFTAQTPLAEVLREAARQYHLHTVFARDVAALHRDGLLILEDLETPGQLAGCVLDLSALAEVARVCSGVVVLDSPEHLLAQGGGDRLEVLDRLAACLGKALRETGLRAVVNLHCTQPPNAVGDLAGGPLFAGQRPGPAPEALKALAGAALERLLALDLPPKRLRVDWHLDERDLASPEEETRRAVGLALAGKSVLFVLDRPRRPVLLAEGIDRRHPTVLQVVGLHLPRLAVQTGSLTDSERFLSKLGSLARLALSAGSQKRAHLRRLAETASTRALSQGFLLERARMLLVPIGLDAVVRTLKGKGLASGGLDLGKQIVQRLVGVLRQACLDGPLGALPPGAKEEPEQVPGLTPWDGQASLKSQWRAAGALQGIAERGTLLLRLAGDMTAEGLLEALRSIREQTDVARVRVLLP